jgi:hypothetical protein
VKNTLLRTEGVALINPYQFIIRMTLHVVLTSFWNACTRLTLYQERSLLSPIEI